MGLDNGLEVRPTGESQLASDDRLGRRKSDDTRRCTPMMADEATESPGIIAGGVSAKPVTSAHYVLFANKSLSAYRRLGVLHRRGVLALDQGLVGQGRKGDRFLALETAKFRLTVGVAL